MIDIFALYKPKGITSRHFLDLVIKEINNDKCGHAGTLDPLAEGVLVIGCRSGTKKLFADEFSEKQYFAVVKLGSFSGTDDEEGGKTVISYHKNPSASNVNSILLKMTGEVEQVPPLFSAVKVKGKKAYKLARKGIFFSIKKRKVIIKKIDLLSYQYPLITMRVTTGPGVYIRSLARDIGKELFCGAYLFDLKRERVGPFSVKDCLNIKGGEALPLNKKMFEEVINEKK